MKKKLLSMALLISAASFAQPSVEGGFMRSNFSAKVAFEKKFVEMSLRTEAKRWWPIAGIQAGPVINTWNGESIRIAGGVYFIPVYENFKTGEKYSKIGIGGSIRYRFKYDWAINAEYNGDALCLGIVFFLWTKKFE